MAAVMTKPRLNEPAAANSDEYELIERLKQDDERAFEQIVTEYKDRIAQLTYRLSGWAAQKDDITQEVFMALWKYRKKFVGKCSLKTWLTTITVNKCRTYRRKNALKLRVLKDATTMAVNKQRPPDTQTITTETLNLVRKTVEKLPNRYREVIVLRYLEGFSITEIAQVVGIKRNTVDVRLSRARAKLKEKLTGQAIPRT